MSNIDPKCTLDELPRMVFETDSELKFLYTNDMAEELLGYDRDKFLKMRLPDIFAEEDRDAVERMVSKLALGTLPLDIDFIFTAVSSDRKKIEVGVLLSAIKRNGEFAGARGLLTDQSEYVAVSFERHQLAAAIDQSGDIVITTDLDGNIEYANPAFERTTQYAINEVLGKNPRIFKTDFHPASYYENLWRTITSGKIWRGRFINRRRDGSLYTEVATISPVKNERGDIVKFVAIKRDVTEVENLQRQLRQSQKMEAVGRMASVVAHDFNNILQIINGYSQLIREEVDEGSPLMKYADCIVEGGRRARELIDKISRFTSTEARALECVDVVEVLGRIQGKLSDLVDGGYEINIKLHSKAGMVSADGPGLENVVSNLVANARDAMPNGGVVDISTGIAEIDVGDIVSESRINPGEYVYIAVADTGCGIEPSNIDKVFDPFFSTKKEGAGTGLGLPTVYSTIDNYNGFVDIKTEPGKGTTFTVYIPRTVDHEYEAATEKGRSQTDSDPDIVSGDARLTLLLAEDEDMVRTFTAGALSKAGFDIIEARNGEEAVRLFEQHRDAIDLALLDVVMPVKQGPDVRDDIRGSGSNIPIIFITGYSEAHTDFDFKNLPDNEAILYKPCGVMDMVNAIRALSVGVNGGGG